MRNKIIASLALLTIGTASYADVTIKSKAVTLKFGGVHRFSFETKDDKLNSANDSSGFQSERNYLQVKAYFDETSKSHARITLDSKATTGKAETSLKYGYVYLSNVLPNTSLKIGQGHTPWIDFEKKVSFSHDATYGVMLDKTKIQSSSDRGISFKTKLNSLTVEAGVFNGEGYKESNYDGVSIDYRLTLDLFKNNKNNYSNISVAGANNNKYKGVQDRIWYLVHGVYKQPEFLVAAQYLKVDKDVSKKGDAYSINADFYPTSNTIIFGRYDQFNYDNGKEDKTIVAGVGYKYNKNIKFYVSNLQKKNNDAAGVKTKNENYYRFTTEVKW